VKFKNLKDYLIVTFACKSFTDMEMQASNKTKGEYDDTYFFKKLLVIMPK